MVAPIMRTPPISLVMLLVIAFSTMGASCSGGSSTTENPPTTNRGSSERPAGPRVEQIAGVDVSELTSAERRIWVDVVNDQLSPCGDPTSVAACADRGTCRMCVPAARYVVRLLEEGRERTEIEELYRSRYGRDTRVEIDTANHPVRGAAMAPITIALFSDFECPYCGRAHPIIQQALEELDGQVQVVFFQYPLTMHTHATPAARAAIAAGNQNKFWEMHDVLFEHQRALEDEDIDGYATNIGLDMERFRADLRSPDTQRRIDEDRALGERLHVEGTPTMFINGRRFSEAPQSLLAYLREELEQ